MPRWRVLADIFYSEFELLNALKESWEGKTKLVQAQIALKKVKIAYEKAELRFSALIFGPKSYEASASFIKMRKESLEYDRRILDRKEKDLKKIKEKLAKFLKKYRAEFKPLLEFSKPYKEIDNLPGEKDPTRQMLARLKKALTKFRKHRSKPLYQIDLYNTPIDWRISLF